MKLATYFDRWPRIGLVEGDEIWDLQQVYARFLAETERTPGAMTIAAAAVPDDMALFVRLNHGNLDCFREALDFISRGRSDLKGVEKLAQPLAKVQLLPPVLTPTKIACCGSAYRDYVIELGRTPDHPRWPTDVKISFLKQPHTLIGHREVIQYPSDSHQWDYENELAIIIGKPCSDISERDARDYIFGFTVFNDACVRDLPDWTGGLESPRGKACDTLAPCGPWIVPLLDLRKDPNDLDFSTRVDGDLRQSGNTSGLLWPIERIVAVAARYFSLSPGDIIATGSTKGNGLSTGKYLSVGQTVVCDFEGIGRLENTAGTRHWRGSMLPLAPERATR